jgi:FixJ family two-component response regulator
MSGYTENAIIHHGVLDSTVHFIQKPFPLTSLMEMIRKILDEAPTQIEALLPQ